MSVVDLTVGYKTGDLEIKKMLDIDTSILATRESLREDSSEQLGLLAKSIKISRNIKAEKLNSH